MTRNDFINMMTEQNFEQDAIELVLCYTDARQESPAYSEIVKAWMGFVSPEKRAANRRQAALMEKVRRETRQAQGCVS